MVPTLEQIAPYAERGLVYQDHLGDLVLSNYSTRCVYSGAWDEVTAQCRGLIINARTSEVVALPFPKFFNVGEDHCQPPSSMPSRVTIKADGVLGIAYRHRGRIRWTTRGKLGSAPGEVAQVIWQEQYLEPHIPQRWTLMAEIIAPECRIQVDYGVERSLRVLAARDRITGAYIDRHELEVWCHHAGLPVIETVPVRSIDDYLRAAEILPQGQEGWVLEWTDGYRAKVKGLEYLRIAKVLTSLSPDYVVKAWARRDMHSIMSIPEEFRSELDSWLAPCRSREHAIEAEARALAFSVAHMDRRGAVAKVGTGHPLFGAVMAIRDGKRPDYRKLVLKEWKQDR